MRRARHGLTEGSTASVASAPAGIRIVAPWISPVGLAAARETLALTVAMRLHADVKIDRESEIRARYELLAPHLDEQQRRLLVAAEAQVAGWGGVRAAHEATGMAKSTIKRGADELTGLTPDVPPDRTRRPGGGRKKAEDNDPALVEALEELIEPDTRGDPESPLRWTCKSLRRLSEELAQRGHLAGRNVVARLLVEKGYSLQGTRKTQEGKQHPDRDAQFRHIYEETKRFQASGQPVISVDTKKKELVGNHSNAGREWRPKGQPVRVDVHDFPDPKVGKAVPYGVLDLLRNEGWVNVGMSKDTAEFAGASIRRWWDEMGSAAYPDATDLLITADCGGSNGHRIRLWKRVLQQLADASGLVVSVAHFPPGTSKWNRIEHQMFSHITANWRGRPLTSHEVVVNLISATRTSKGLRIKAKLDKSEYRTGIKVSDDEMANIHIERSEFHGDWNYSILPRETGSVIS